MIRVLVLILLFGLATPAAAQEMRRYVDDLGHEVMIPVRPQRIVSVRGEQFSAPLVELGAPIVGSTGRTDPNRNNGAPYIRGAYDALDFRFDQSGIEWVGTPGGYDLEKIAALGPDLIIAPDWDAENYDKLSAIAPTVLISPWKNGFLEKYRKVADLAGMTDAFERRLGLYRERIERARDVIGDPSAITVSILDAYDGTLTVFKEYDALSQVLDDLGFDRPDQVAAMAEPLQEGVSGELIQQFDGDFIISTYQPAMGQPIADREAAFDAAMPRWREVLHAVRNNQHIFIHRDEMRAVSFQALRSVIDIVLSNIAGRDFVSLADG